MRVREVKGYEEAKEIGDYFWYFRHGKRGGIHIVCLCGALICTDNGWRVVNEKPLTLSPSLLHIDEGCHFFIKNGEIQVC